jgi:hypothetical protein
MNSILSNLLLDFVTTVYDTTKPDSQNAKQPQKPDNSAVLRSRVFLEVWETNGWKPSSREGATLSILQLGKATYALMFGGLSHSLHSDMWLYDFSHKKWKKQHISGDLTFYGRFGHTLTPFRNKFYMFGGSLLYSSTTKTMECLNDTAIFSPERRQFTQLKTTGQLLEPRRDHVADILDHFLIVHGGISTRGTYLSDTHCLDLGTHSRLIF